MATGNTIKLYDNIFSSNAFLPLPLHASHVVSARVGWYFSSNFTKYFLFVPLFFLCFNIMLCACVFCFQIVCHFHLFGHNIWHRVFLDGRITE